jgi:hypothetical protein
VHPIDGAREDLDKLLVAGDQVEYEFSWKMLSPEDFSDIWELSRRND